MTIEEAVSYFGSGGKLARALDIFPQSITNWRRINNKIPYIHQLRIEKLTHGHLIAVDNNNYKNTPKKKE